MVFLVYHDNTKATQSKRAANRVWYFLYLVRSPNNSINLVMSKFLTFLGAAQFQTGEEISNKHNPARFMHSGRRKQLLNQLNG